MADNAIEANEHGVTLSPAVLELLALIAELKVQRENFWSEVFILRERVAVLESNQRRTDLEAIQQIRDDLAGHIA